MAHLDTRYLVDTGEDNPSLQLDIKLHEFDNNFQIRVVVTRERRIPDFSEDRIPAYYNFDDEQPGNSANPDADPPVLARAPVPPKITIIAAPGVSIKVIGFDNFQRPSLDRPLVDVFRVQDPNLVPTLGARFSPSHLTENFFINTRPPTHVGPSPHPPDEDGHVSQNFDSRYSSEDLIERYNDPFTVAIHWYHIFQYDPLESLQQGFTDLFEDIFSGDSDNEDHDTPERDTVETISEATQPRENIGARHAWLPPRNHLDVVRTQNGVQFIHRYSSQTLEVKVRTNHLQLSSRQNRIEHLQRFTFELTNNADLDMPLVKIVKTHNVETSLTLDINASFTDEPRNRYMARLRTPFFDVKNTDFENIPPEGAPLPTRNLSNAHIRLIVPPWVSVLQVVTDIAIGFVPVIGDAVDIAEFGNAMMNGTDRWGRRLAGWEKAVMGIGAVLTLVGPSISALRRLPQLFGRQADAAGRLHAAIRVARYTDEESNFMAGAYEALASGRRLGQLDVQRLQRLLRRIPGCPA